MDKGIFAPVSSSIFTRSFAIVRELICAFHIKVIFISAKENVTSYVAEW